MNGQALKIDMHFSDGSYGNLGLIRMCGSCSHEVLKDLLQKNFPVLKLT